ncbi:hypothetical protein LX64_00363 [Chitinophaga skermanii]|uniref:EboA family metabolite traffic protein n=1 Tax=Chitinophaga skermanii TaxID=331697 RepID=A0A327R1K8_9BACT|nr:EboA domain-containing protein [Chitinophaga skermanii]RAJ10756.1 hypothetical protein LX64_00363 [Chitinophaga skermanii]
MGKEFVYDQGAFRSLLEDLLFTYASEQGKQWLDGKLGQYAAQFVKSQFNATFSAIPRFVGKQVITLSTQEAEKLDALVPGFSALPLSIDRLARTWWILQVPTNNEDQYITTIEPLFLAAEMNELVTLYRALPLLAFPSHWTHLTSEGIRSNIASVQDAVMLQNPYPASYLNENAWNQLVLKAIFTNKPVHQIIGLDERANASLALVLSDYAHERWAAGRTVDPMLWRLVGPFINEKNLPDITRVLQAENNVEREAAALACAAADYPPAKTLLQQSNLAQAVENGSLTWNTVASRLI